MSCGVNSSTAFVTTSPLSCLTCIFATPPSNCAIEAMSCFVSSSPSANEGNLICFIFISKSAALIDIFANSSAFIPISFAISLNLLLEPGSISNLPFFSLNVVNSLVIFIISFCNPSGSFAAKSIAFKGSNNPLAVTPSLCNPAAISIAPSGLYIFSENAKTSLILRPILCDVAAIVAKPLIPLSKLYKFILFKFETTSLETPLTETPTFLA